MTRQEIMETSFGEMRDMISCLSVYQGTAEQKENEIREEIPMEKVLQMR